MRQLFVWVLSAVLFAAMGGLGMWFFVTGETDHEEHGPPATESAPAEIPPVSRDETGAVVLHLDEATQKRVGLQITLLPAATDQPEVVAYGAVQEDPAQSFTLRAPLPGTLMASKDGGWPQIGQQVAAGATVGALAPRLGPVEQADLMAKLAAAQADEQEARASLDSLRLSLESKRKLNAEQKIVSDQVLQEAEAKAKGEEARLRGAQETVKVLQASAAGLALTQTVPLVVGKAGRVLEVMAQPGEAVEGGLALVRLASTDRLVAKV